MVTVALVSAGYMGSGLGAALRQGGARVVTTLEGRSPRTARLATEAGLELLPTLTDVLVAADVVLSVTPPGAAVETARSIAAAARQAGRAPIVADLNAVSPTTMEAVSAALAGTPGPAAVGGALGVAGDAVGSAGFVMGGVAGSAAVAAGGTAASAGVAEGGTAASAAVTAGGGAASPAAVAGGGSSGIEVVDGSISGPPPTVTPGARLYLSGAAASVVAELPWGGLVEPVVVGERIGSASALKMCTGGVYKGLTALITQAMRTAGAHGVLEHVMADLGRNGLADGSGVARSATKAGRFVDEMREVAATQAAAGLSPDLFTAIAAVYADVAGTHLAEGAPEDDRKLSPSEIVERLDSRHGR
ncbi:NAD(P)-dependent oxidoreductase [Actinoplanes sp. LDG1-06]|uniref:NAD(P)-dependent oxidoreductase n=1 Tax=Paractinoplanes ovalisporus TaxID=2810368 RepID=A0ABS2AS53_9ACTN|nr:NAD(P)-dependent oxidoreductase [Actinoplanes ovalisporus]MBM2621979.1 NAD(P)-dependent oxidoreductase [Actinoplanes ovalisporus]